MRRIMKGRIILCNYLILWLFRSSCSAFVRLTSDLRSNHSSKSEDDWKISGSKKLSKDQSSCKLFWSGVPVSSSLYLDFISLILLDVWLSSFLILWASSMMMYCHENRFNAFRHSRIASKVVMQTSKLPGKSSFLMISSLNSFLAIKLHILIYGHHLLNSWIQFPTTDLGMMIRWCPLIFLFSLRKAMREIVWMVLPKPISSARMPFIPVSNKLIIQLSPSS